MPRRSRLGVGLSLVAHLVLILVLVELTRNASFWSESTPEGAPGRAGAGGGGGQQVGLIQLPSPPPPPQPIARAPTPVRVPTAIPPVEQAVTAPPAPDTLPRAAAPGDSTGSGGGAGGGSGTGTGPGSGAGTGPGGSAGPAAADSARLSGRPPEPSRLILPPFDYPRSMRGLSIDVNFFVLADGRVDRVVFIPEIADRGYAKKLEDAMRAYRFRPARSAEGRAVPGVAIVRVSF